MNRIKRYKIMLIEPSPLIAAGLTEMMKQTNEFVITHTINDSSGCTEAKIKVASPDIVIIDPIMMNYAERQSVRDCLSISSNTVVIALISGVYDEDVLNSFDGCLNLYDTYPQIVRKLHDAIKAVDKEPHIEHNDLSKRERTILIAIAQGKSNKEIADEFHLSIYTVLTHRKNISHKLGIKSISGLTVYAIMNKMIDMREM